MLAIEKCSYSQVSGGLGLIDSCITQLKAQGPSRTCNESEEEDEEGFRGVLFEALLLVVSLLFSLLLSSLELSDTQVYAS